MDAEPGIFMVRMVLMWVGSHWAFELKPGLNKLGRNPTNDFRISDPSVSSFHAELLVKDNIIRVRDLGSTNGTFLDDRRIEEGILESGNVLRLGTVQLKLDEVAVTPVPRADSATFSGGQGINPSSALPEYCACHPGVVAVFQCENCAGGFCDSCVRVVGHDRAKITTVCPVCKGQCYPLAQAAPRNKQKSLLSRLTQTLKIPFAR